MIYYNNYFKCPKLPDIACAPYDVAHPPLDVCVNCPKRFELESLIRRSERIHRVVKYY